MATPKIIADFETQLSAAISIGDTSFTLASATDDDGNALPTGLYYFTIENGSSNKEYLAGTLSGTTVSSVVTVSRQGTETSGAAKAHRVGASVIISDFLTYKKYMDEIALVSAPDADTNTKGVVEEATTAEIDAGTATGGTGAELFVAPDALAASIYNTQLPSADEKTFLTNLETGNSAVQPQVVTFTTSGTWTKDTGLKYVVVEAVGGGGGGGGAQSAASDYSVGAGGGAGGYSRRLILASALGSTETVTIGAAGTAGANTGGNGGNGGNTTFGALLTAGGGSGGSGDDGDGEGGAGGTASTGDINVPGGDGVAGYAETGTTTVFGGGNSGGASYFGGGGAGGAGINTAGNDGSAYGSGGGGATSFNNSLRAGGAGAPGIVIVTEYYS